jgi:hypothetical protein
MKITGKVAVKASVPRLLIARRISRQAMANVALTSRANADRQRAARELAPRAEQPGSHATSSSSVGRRPVAREGAGYNLGGAGAIGRGRRAIDQRLTDHPRADFLAHVGHDVVHGRLCLAHPSRSGGHHGSCRLAEVAFFARRAQVVLARGSAGCERHDVVDVQDDAGITAGPTAIAAAKAIALQDREAQLRGQGIAGSPAART